MASSSNTNSTAAAVSSGPAARASGSAGAGASAVQANQIVTTFSSETIRLIAETIGTSNLSEEACRDLISDLTFTLKNVLTEAKKFARKSKRKKLVAMDIDASLRVKNFEPIYGFNSFDSTPFRCVTGPGASSKTIYFAEDQLLDLNELISANNTSIKLPNDLVINAHWLAIEGVQPRIPENPQVVSVDSQKKELSQNLLGGLSSRNATAGGACGGDKKKSVSSVEFKSDGLKVKSILPHDLSIEQQIYFKEITEACVGNDENKRSEALNSLANDPGLHQLLPRFILFISEGVRLNIHQLNMVILIYLMRMTKSIIENKSIYLEKYLHEIIPSILTCVLCKQVCLRPEVDNHAALREFGAHIIGQLVHNYGSTITSLQTRLIKVYVNSIKGENTSLATLFGALAGLTEFGNEVCESIIFPLVKPIGMRLAQILDSTTTGAERQPAEKIRDQLTDIIFNVLKDRPSIGNSAPASNSNEFDYLVTEFGAYMGQIVHERLGRYRSANAATASSVSMNAQIKPITITSQK